MGAIIKSNISSLYGLLLATPLVVIADRTAHTAQRLGFRVVKVAERAEDAAIVRALCALIGN